MKFTKHIDLLQAYKERSENWSSKREEDYDVSDYVRLYLVYDNMAKLELLNAVNMAREAGKPDSTLELALALSRNITSGLESWLKSRGLPPHLGLAEYEARKKAEAEE